MCWQSCREKYALPHIVQSTSPLFWELLYDFLIWLHITSCLKAPRRYYWTSAKALLRPYVNSSVMALYELITKAIFFIFTSVYLFVKCHNVRYVRKLIRQVKKSCINFTVKQCFYIIVRYIKLFIIKGQSRFVFTVTSDYL